MVTQNKGGREAEVGPTPRAKTATGALRQHAVRMDVDAMLERAHAMSDVLAEIAVENQHDKPDIASRVAMGAARAATEVIGGLMLKERLTDLEEMVKAMASERGKRDRVVNVLQGDPGSDEIGTSALSGVVVKRPSWGRPKKGRLTEPTFEEVEQDLLEGRGEPHGDNCGNNRNLARLGSGDA